jgi:hypothetical protein
MPVKKIIDSGLELGSTVTTAGGQVFDVVEGTVTRVGSSLDTYVAPVRETFIKKYPTLFGMMVTVGLIATFLGLEQMLLKFSILNDYPVLLLLFGIGLLALTGRFYKKMNDSV